MAIGYIKRGLIFLWALALLVLSPIFFYNYDSFIEWIKEKAYTLPLKEMPKELRNF